MALLVGFWLGRRGTPDLLADTPALVREVRTAGELVTVKHTVQKVVGLREPQTLLGLRVGEESLLLVVQARVLGGVDLTQIGPDDVRVTPERHVFVRLPRARVLEAFLDEGATRVWDRRTSGFAPWLPPSRDLESRARQAALAECREAAVAAGLLRDADAQAARVLERLLTAAGASRVTIVPPGS